MKTMCILIAGPEVLRELLRLPPGTHLIDMRVPFEQPGVLELKIEGAGWITPEGQVIQRAQAAEVTRDELDGVIVDWKLPPNAE